MPPAAPAALIVFGATLVVRGLIDAGRVIGEVTPGWTVAQAVGFTATVILALRAIGDWRAQAVVWDERLRRRLLVAASSGFVTMLALAATLLFTASFILLSDMAVAYLQAGIGILTLGVGLWEREEG